MTLLAPLSPCPPPESNGNLAGFNRVRFQLRQEGVFPGRESNPQPSRPLQPVRAGRTPCRPGALRRRGTGAHRRELPGHERRGANDGVHGGGRALTAPGTHWPRPPPRTGRPLDTTRPLNGVGDVHPQADLAGFEPATSPQSGALPVELQAGTLHPFRRRWESPTAVAGSRPGRCSHTVPVATRPRVLVTHLGLEPRTLGLRGPCSDH